MDVLVVGGGIGGLAAALALARDGHQVRVLEKAAEFAELGAGLQLAPNATRVLRRLGVLDQVLAAGVRPRRLVLRSALTASELTSLDLGEAFQARYGAPYAGVRLMPAKDAQAVADGADGASVCCADGSGYQADAVIVADGLHSLLRRMFTDDELICSGFAAYRGTARAELVTARSELDEVVGWIGLTEYQHLRAPQAMRVQRTARTWGDIWHVDGVGALQRDELFRRRPADDYGYTDWLYGSVGTSVR